MNDLNLKNMREKTWQKGAPSQIILNSIFAALVGVLIVFVITDETIKNIGNVFKFIELIILSISFILFAISAEETLDALDEKDVKKYVYYFLHYNLGVILLGVSMVIAIYARFNNKSVCHNSILLILLIIFYLVLLKKWICDLWWLLSKGKEEFMDYFDELEDRKEPVPDPSCSMQIFYKCKNINMQNQECGHVSNKLPHGGVYVRLRSSPIHGIGVFAIRDIPSGTNIFDDDASEIIWICKDEIQNLDSETMKLYDDFCIIKGNKYGCPINFNSLTVGWYLNESKENPNVRATNDYDFIAIRDIKKGEELTVDYSTFSDYPKTSEKA